MKKLLFVLAAFMLLFTACESSSLKEAESPVEETVQAAVPGLVYSNSFDGNLDGWNPRGGSEKLDFEDGALHVSNRTATWNGIIKSFDGILLPGREYSITLTVKYTEGKPGQSVVMSVQQGQPGGGDSYTNLKTVNLTKGEWKTETFSYTVPETAAEYPVMLYFETPYKSDAQTTADDVFDFYIDDIQIVQTSVDEPSSAKGPMTIAYQNLFDSDLDGWAPRGGNEKLTLEDGALHVSNRTATWNGVGKVFGGILEAGKAYKIAITVKYTDGKDNQSVVFSSHQKNASGDVYTNLKTISLTKGEWKTAELQYTVPEDAGLYPVMLYFESPYKTDDQVTPDDIYDFYIDGIVISTEGVKTAKAEENLSPLYQQFSFPLGVAVRPDQFMDTSINKPLLNHFNAYVTENVMKQENIQPTRGNYTFGAADYVVDQAAAEGKLMRGHVLIWHSQVPGWFFKGTGKDGMATKEELYATMYDHINTTVTHFKGRVDSWDVVNEVLEENGSLRNSDYLKISGSYEYIANAFRWAHEADPDAKLFINDYNIEYSGAKQNGMYELVKQLLADGVPVDGVGLQCHIGLTYPSVAEIQKAIQRFASLGVEVQVTELDMSIYSNDSEKEKTEVDDILLQQAYKYKQLFDVFQEEYEAGHLTMVMMWGLSDKETWLNDFPVAGRTNYPLFFDHYLKAKPAYWIFVDESKVPAPAPKEEIDMSKFPKLTAVKGTPVLGADDAVWNKAADNGITLKSDGTALDGSTFKVLWDEKNLYVRVSVKDNLLNIANINEWEQDSIEVFVDQNNGKTAYYEDDDAQYRVNCRNSPSFNGGTPELFSSWAKTTADGYVVEVACPLDRISPAAGTMIGFDVQVNEADASGARVGVRNWSCDTNQGYRDTSAFGIVVLAD